MVVVCVLCYTVKVKLCVSLM